MKNKKKIFLVVNSIMNGTVTMSNYIDGLEAINFAQAKKKLLNIIKKNKTVIENQYNGSDGFSFSVKQPDETMLECHCELQKKPLRMI